MIFSFRRQGRLSAALAFAAVLSACSDTEVTHGEGAVPAGGPGVSDTGLSELFRTSVAIELKAQDEETAKRTLLVTVDEDVFEQGKAPLNKVGSTFLLRLFDSVKVTGIVDQVSEPEAGSYVLLGRLQGAENGFFTLAYGNGAVSATIELPGTGSYAIEWAGEGKHRLVEKTGFSPPCNQLPPALPLLPKLSASAASAAPLAKVAAAVPYVDVAVFYTPKALAEHAGNVTAMTNQIIEAFTQANLALANSKVNLRVRLVRAEQVTYNEVDMDTDLSRFQGETDGYMDGVHAVRNTYKADLMSLWTGYAAPPYAGVAYTMDPNWRNTGFARYAFSVVARKYATTNYTFAHELAHNMGCEHNTGTGYLGAYPYSYGHRFTIGATQYRTVMSYAPGNSVPYFSNPAVTYTVANVGSAPTGVANVSDNALSLNQLKDIVAMFQNAPPTASVSSPLAGTTYNAGASIAVNCSVSEADGSIAKVEIWRGTTLMATKTVSPYSHTWTGATSGTHSLTCKAFDDKGASKTSGAVSITVNASNVKTVNPSADARVRDGSYASTNYGTSNPLEIQTSTTAGNNRDSYLKFSLGSVTTVANAKLRFYANLSATGSVPVTAHDVAATTWIESGTGSITWNNKPARGASRGTFTVNSTSLKWYEVDVTAYVAAQKTAGKADVGFALHNATAGSILVKANSREASSGKPELRITQ